MGFGHVRPYSLLIPMCLVGMEHCSNWGCAEHVRNTFPRFHTRSASMISAWSFGRMEMVAITILSIRFFEIEKCIFVFCFEIDDFLIFESFCLPLASRRGFFPNENSNPGYSEHVRNKMCGTCAEHGTCLKPLEPCSLPTKCNYVVYFAPLGAYLHLRQQN